MDVDGKRGVFVKIIIGLLLLVAAPAFAEYRAIYTQPRTAAEAELAAPLQAAQALEKFSAIVNRTLRVDRDIPVVATSCGTPNAFYSPEKKAVFLCYELLVDNARKLGAKTKGLSSRQMADVWMAELAFILLHEIGHSVIDEFQLPVLGGEEDAADQFATFMLLTSNGSHVLKQATMWFYTGKPGLLTTLFNSSRLYGDEHSLMQQRFANVICWGFGRDPNEFAQLAVAAKVPESRLMRCQNEYAKLDRDMRRLLGTSLAGGAAPVPLAANYGSAAAQVVQPGPVPVDGWVLAKRHRCVFCHLTDSGIIGPSFKEIAQRYRGAASTEKLVSNVAAGSVGAWGRVPAPPANGVPNEDLQQIVRWILDL